MPGGIIALDLATNLGWAAGPLPRQPLTYMEAVAIKPPQPKSGIFRVQGRSAGEFLSFYADWLEKMLNEHKPNGIIFEAPIVAGHGNMNTTRKLVGLASVTLMLAFDFRISWVREGYPSQVKLHICGYGGPGKERVMAAISDRGWTYSDDNEADALALFDYAGHLYARERRAA